MSMRIQVAEVGTYEITIDKNNHGFWHFWIKQKGHLLIRSTGTRDCEETKLLVANHLYEIVMNRKEKSHFDPSRSLEWHNYLYTLGGAPEIAG